MKIKITNYGVQKLLENFTDSQSFYQSFSVRFTDSLYMKLESIKQTLLQKVEITDKARAHVIDQFVADGKAVKEGIPGTEAYKLTIKEDYQQEFAERISSILNTTVDVDIEQCTIEEFEDTLGPKKDWRLSVPNRQFIALLTSNN